MDRGTSYRHVNHPASYSAAAVLLKFCRWISLLNAVLLSYHGLALTSIEGFQQLRNSEPTKPRYSVAVAENHVADTLADIQRSFFKRFSLDLPPDQDPTSEEMGAVDDSIPDPEPLAPDADVLSAEDYTAAMELFDRQRTLLIFRKGQIKRWMAYQYWKDREETAKGSEVQDAFLTLLQRLTGKGLPKPRRITASNHWQQTQESKLLVDAEVTRRLQFSTKAKERAGIRSKVVSDLFKALPEAERAEWEDSSVHQHELALAEWEEKTSGPPSTAPEDRQKYIQALIPFMQRILTLVTEVTDMKTTFLAGGPEPADAGRLNVISVHAGHCPGNIRMNFGVSEREAYKKQVLPVFGQFLKKCYTIEDCRARALPVDTVSLAASFEEHAAYATVDSLGSLGAPFPPLLSLPSLVDPPPPLPECPLARRHRMPPRLFRFPEPGASPPPLRVPLSRPQTPATPQLASDELARALRPSASPMPSAPPSLCPSPLCSPHSLPGHSLRPSVPRTPQARPDVFSGGPPFTQVPPTTPPSPPMPSPVLRIGTNTPARKRRNDDTMDGPSKRTKPLTAPSTPTPLPTPVAPSSPAPASPPHPRPRPRPRPHPRVPAPPVPSAPPLPAPPAPPALSTTTVPPGAPKWFKLALTMFNSDTALGKEWNALVCSWAAFELRENYAGTVKFPCKDRPEFVSGWIKRARAISYRPINSSNVEDTETSMTAWWSTVPPAQVACSGVNGVLSLLAGLFMWGVAISDAPAAHRTAWVKLLADVHVAFLDTLL
ncbi:hypothetical protein FPV67DRAFT_1455898 [Lyophyllum atratum]|nr:hypothetical protein FPV67DRAFT_1455898 [Lyophyllum atratum]